MRLRVGHVLSRTALIALLVVFAGFALRLALWARVPAAAHMTMPDTGRYLDSARALLALGRFSVSPEQPDTPETIRTPGYPAFVALVYAALGMDDRRVTLAHTLVSVLTLALTYRLGRQLFPRTPGVALGALLFASLDAPSLHYTLMLLTETLFALLIAAALVCGTAALRLTRRPATGRVMGWSLACGAALALATLTRPIGLFLLAPLGLAWFVWLWRGWRSPVRAALVTVCLLAPLVVTIAGWRARNLAVAGTSQFSTLEGVNLKYYWGAAIVGYRDGLTFEAARDQLAGGSYGAALREHSDYPERRLSDRWAQEGAALISGHPLLFARVELVGAARLFGGLGEGAFFETLALPSGGTGLLGTTLAAVETAEPALVTAWIGAYPAAFAVTLALLAHLALLYVGALLWAWQAARRRLHLVTMAQAFALLIAAYLVVLSLGPQAHARFRVPFVGVLAVFAAAGWSVGRGRKQGII